MDDERRLDPEAALGGERHEPTDATAREDEAELEADLAADDAADADKETAAVLPERPALSVIDPSGAGKTGGLLDGGAADLSTGQGTDEGLRPA